MKNEGYEKIINFVSNLSPAVVELSLIQLLRYGDEVKGFFLNSVEEFDKFYKFPMGANQDEFDKKA